MIVRDHLTFAPCGVRAGIVGRLAYFAAYDERHAALVDQRGRRYSLNVPDYAQRVGCIWRDVVFTHDGALFYLAPRMSGTIRHAVLWTPSGDWRFVQLDAPVTTLVRLPSGAWLTRRGALWNAYTDAWELAWQFESAGTGAATVIPVDKRYLALLYGTHADIVTLEGNTITGVSKRHFGALFHWLGVQDGAFWVAWRDETSALCVQRHALEDNSAELVLRAPVADATLLSDGRILTTEAGMAAVWDRNGTTVASFKLPQNTVPMATSVLDKGALIIQFAAFAIWQDGYVYMINAEIDADTQISNRLVTLSDGRLEVRRLPDGYILKRVAVPDGTRLCGAADTAFAVSANGAYIILRKEA